MRKLIYLFLSIALFSCQGKDKVITTNDDQITFQALSVKGDDPYEVSFKVRVYPDVKWTEDGGKKLGEKMMYHVDSCFSIVKNNVTYYPERIMPIANGMSANFEYLISFASLPDQNLKDSELIYRDKYMSRKDYKLLLN